MAGLNIKIKHHFHNSLLELYSLDAKTCCVPLEERIRCIVLSVCRAEQSKEIPRNRRSANAARYSGAVVTRTSRLLREAAVLQHPDTKVRSVFSISLGTHSKKFSSSTVSLFRSVVSYRGPSVELQRPVVILHGLFGSYLNWRTIAKRLVQSTKTDAFLFDLRNHGSSPHADEMTYDVMVEDIKAALKEEKNIRAAQLLGHSMVKI